MTGQQDLIREFEKQFGSGGEIRLFFAPGRVNLIGDHTDYNGGHAFPCALVRGISAAVRLRTDRRVQITSLNLDPGRIFCFDADSEIPEWDMRGGWVNHILCIIKIFREEDYVFPVGFDMMISGDLPIGSGLSSSGAMQALSAITIRALYDFMTIGNEELASFCRKVDSLHTGIDSGIVNAYSSLMGRAGHGVFISSQKLHYEYVPLVLKNAVFVVTDSRIRQSMTKELFTERKNECEKALRKLQSVANINCLCDLGTDRFESCKDVIMQETYTKRARHVVYEDARTVRAVSALRVGNLSRFGALMLQSHASLRDDYEISLPEIDFLVEEARDCEGVYGSRMTGGGRGGCTLTLIEQDAVPAFRERLHHAYHQKYGLHPLFFVLSSGDGARELV